MENFTCNLKDVIPSTHTVCISEESQNHLSCSKSTLFFAQDSQMYFSKYFKFPIEIANWWIISTTLSKQFIFLMTASLSSFNRESKISPIHSYFIDYVYVIYLFKGQFNNLQTIYMSNLIGTWITLEYFILHLN